MKISVKKGDAIYGLKKGLPYTDRAICTCDDRKSTPMMRYSLAMTGYALAMMRNGGAMIGYVLAMMRNGGVMMGYALAMM